MSSLKAPIAIFCYRRPEHLRKTLQSLMLCDGFDDSPVFLFGDGPRNTVENMLVDETRRVALSLLGQRAQFFFSEMNCGLSSSVITGINAVLESYERVIVIEDDLELSSDFLSYMNTALERYALHKEVYQISGYMFESPEINIRKDALFLPFTISWGWATWRRAWDKFEPDAPNWRKLLSDRVLRKRFNVDGTYDFSNMLVRQMIGLRDSWAVRWCWSVFSQEGVVLYPPVSMVKNTGFDGSGTHGRGFLRRFSVSWDHCESGRINFPERTVVDPVLYGYVKQALWRQNGGYLGRLIDQFRWFRTCYLVNQRVRQFRAAKL